MKPTHVMELELIQQLVERNFPGADPEKIASLASALSELNGNSVTRAYDVGLEKIRKSGAGRHMEMMGEIHLEDGKFESAVIFQRLP